MAILYNTATALLQCDCCGRKVTRLHHLVAYGIETYACDECAVSVMAQQTVVTRPDPPDRAGDADAERAGMTNLRECDCCGRKTMRLHHVVAFGGLDTSACDDCVGYDAEAYGEATERECPECSGRGWVEYEGRAQPPDGRYETWRDACPECDGRGFITLQPVTAEDLP